MKQICWTVIGGLLISLGAAAQDNATLDQAKKEMNAALEKMAAEAKVIGPERIMLTSPVTGAPYAADEVTTFTQTLGDGTRIQREDKVPVYRDGQGRVRRETPKEITIMDPVAGAAYSIDPNQGTALKIMVTKTGATQGFLQMDALLAGQQAGQQAHGGVGFKVIGDAAAADAAKLKEFKASAEQEAAAGTAGSESRFVFVAGGPVNGEAAAKASANSQSLGMQSIEGVLSEGTSTTETIPAGVIGNDKPIQVVNERWYSSELKTLTMTKHSDPRTGEQIFRLTNIRRGEPSPDLFQPPAGCQTLGPCTTKQE
jgi:hypothetical protein